MAYLLQATRLDTVKKFVNLVYVPECVHAHVPHVIARDGARVIKQKVSNSRETYVLIKATRTHSPIFENQPHLLLLTVFPFG